MTSKREVKKSVMSDKDYLQEIKKLDDDYISTLKKDPYIEESIFILKDIRKTQKKVVSR